MSKSNHNNDVTENEVTKKIMDTLGVKAKDELVAETKTQQASAAASDESQELPAMPHDQLFDELQAAQALAKENWEKVLRIQAEMQNLQRRTERDIANAHKFALEKFIEALIPVLDSIDRALEVTSSNSETLAMREGIELTRRQFVDVLSKFNVREINPVAEVFDATQHEALTMQEDQTVKSGTILQVVQRGYELNGRLVRPARVIVAK